MRIKQDTKLDFSDVLIVPQRSTLNSRKDVKITRDFTFKHSDKEINNIFGVIAANMDSVGSFAMSVALSKYNAMTALHKFYTTNQIVNHFINYPHTEASTFITVGPNDNDFAKLKEITWQIQRYNDTPANRKLDIPKWICLDAANGYTENFVKHLEILRESYPNCIIMAGNVVTPNITEELIIRGADIVKIGIGSGSVCLTRKCAGVGVPQFSACMECAFAAHGVGGHICSDGGCTVEGDICKAFCSGSDFVMSGSLFSGTDQCEGKWQIIDGQTYFKYHGMSSKEAMKEWYGGINDYRASEGKEVMIPAKGSVEDIMKSIAGSVRSCCTYIGASEIKHMPKCAEFIMVNNQLNKIYN